MASSDDEDERLPSEVSDYFFVDSNEEPISFSELPLKWDDAKSFDGNKEEIGLRGSTDNGLQKIFEQVTAWKFDISYSKPEILVLTRKNNWIKLLKPRKSYEGTIRTILITLHCLNYVRRNPETSGKALWENLAKVFSLYEARPSEHDLVGHLNLISEAVKRDEILARSKALVTFLEDKPTGKKVFSEEFGTATKSNFIVDDFCGESDESGEDGSDDEGEDFFEHVCAICDNGGAILCCEGKCLRSFHATRETGAQSNCESLGFSDEKVKALANQTFECKNCQYKQHQCFVCGKLGSSDKSAGAEVFKCVTGTCGYFYHPNCVAKALQFKFGDKAKYLEPEIAAGKPFMCPFHFCFRCFELEPEDKNDLQMQFAVCRRCPKAYHRKCLPRAIAFEDDENQRISQRAWEGLMPNRILIYCLKHKIDDELQTPVRNHIKFPDTERKKNQTSESAGKEKVIAKKRVIVPKDVAGEKTAAKQSKAFEKSSSAVKQVDSAKTNEGRLSIVELSKKRKLADNSEAALKKNLPGKKKKSTDDENRPSLGEQLYALCNKNSEIVKKVKGETADSKEPKRKGSSVAKEVNNSVVLDADSKRRILSIVKEAECSITLEDVVNKHKAPSTHGSSLKHVTQAMQSITLGKVEGSIEALHAALQKLEEGGNLEDAKAVCEPGLLNQITKWNSKLRVYLSPFLNGMRYTSFGRHFTKVDKLQEIVDKLHWYVEDGDMIVDFCCGANDFSWLMKQKMDETGKCCQFKNYDILPAKNDFNFEKKDWMTVQLSDLPRGSRMIMGLNPPFGVNAALANKFIDKALQFKPKLLILIVPRETRRLNEKSYDLIWEDDKLLSGKSFYLPGSIDINEKQADDWNVKAPPLYLWSHPEWTTKHKEIARRQGHLPGTQTEELHQERDISDCLPEPTDLYSNAGFQDAEQLQERGEKVTESHIEGLCHSRGDIESPKHHGRKDQLSGDCQQENIKETKHGSGPDKKSQGRQSLPRHSTPKAGGRSWDLAKRGEMSSHAEVQRQGYQHVEHTNVSGSQQHMERGYFSYQDDGMARRNSSNIEERYLGMGNRWQHSVDTGSDYGLRALAEQFADYSRDPTSVPGHFSERNVAYGRSVDPGSDYGLRASVEQFVDYSRDPTSVPGHFSERNEAYGREADVMAQARFYGHQDPAYATHAGNHLGSPAPVFSSSTYSQVGATVGPAYNSMNISTMQRYAPRLDHVNTLTRMSSVGSTQYLDNRNGMHNVATRPGSDRLDFVPGPYPPFSQQSSSGWLYE